MAPTLLPGARVRISPLPYLRQAPQRGDVVLIKAPEAANRYDLKRVAAVPGDNVDGILGAEDYFVVGDNRAESRDSRAYGPVKISAILGKADLEALTIND
jgi:type IV secretory pathway protease TraF